VVGAAGALPLGAVEAENIDDDDDNKDDDDDEEPKTPKLKLIALPELEEEEDEEEDKDDEKVKAEFVPEPKLNAGFDDCVPKLKLKGPPKVKPPLCPLVVLELVVAPCVAELVENPVKLDVMKKVREGSRENLG
jgi:hypothetical protein